eukprot:m.47952 g.47952  ORF g.47952 m.47952 type:complete len:411 (+) comp6008_c0_seq2:143-1375(+)
MNETTEGGDGKPSLPPELHKLHGRCAQAVAREPLCSVAVEKHDNALGMVLAGGAPFCSCVFIESIQNPSLLAMFEVGDEIVALNQCFLLGRSIDEVETYLKESPSPIEIMYRKLPEALPISRIDVSLKRTQQFLAEHLQTYSGALDFLGIRRAALEDNEELDLKQEHWLQSLAVITDIQPLLARYVTALGQVHASQEALGAILAVLATREVEPALREPFAAMAVSHRAYVRHGQQAAERLQRVQHQLQTFSTKIAPDMDATRARYNKERVDFLAHAIRVWDLQASDAKSRERDEATSDSLTGHYVLRDALRACVRARRSFDRVRRDLDEKLDISRSTIVRNLWAHVASIATAVHDYLGLCEAAAAVAETAIARYPDEVLHRIRALAAGDEPGPAADVDVRGAAAPDDRGP